MTLSTAPRPTGTPRDLLEAGRLAMDRFDWPESRDLLAAALAAEESPETLEHLAVATFWSGEVGRAVELRQRAYRLYSDRGDRRGAARVATSLTLDYEDHLGETAIASGWEERASHLLEDVEPCAEHAWLLLWKAHHAILFHDQAELGRALLAEAVELARRIDLAPVEMLARGLRGFTLVAEGKLAEGMRFLDETATAAIAGEIKDPDARGNACCYVLTACESVLDLDRAGQWQRRVRKVYEHRDDQLGLTFCRKHHINVLLWSGEWTQAEAEIERMSVDLPRDMPLLAREVKMALGELRLRQGRPAEARAIFDEEPAHPRAMLGRATLELEDERAEAALRIADRYLRQLAEPLRTDHVPGLWLVVRAACATGEVERAAAAAGKIETLAAALGTDAMKALAAASRGLLARARADFESARADLEQAITLFAASPAPFEAAQARLALASVLRALDDEETAGVEARAALTAFTRLGAARGIERASRECEPGPSSSTVEETALPLSERELEVLRLVAQGLANAEIAARLHLSSHTVKRHVANILGKLDLPTRAAAAALAVRSGLS